MTKTKKLRFETLQLHVGQEQPGPSTDARTVPIYQTTSHMFHDSAHAAARFGLQSPSNIYGGLTNLAQGVFEQRIAALRGGIAGVAAASDVVALTYVFENVTRTDDRIVAAKIIYDGTYDLLAHTLPSYGITITSIAPDDLFNSEKATQGNTKAVLTEILGNPNSDTIDIDAVTGIVYRYGISPIVDNTFGTPFSVHPTEHGADIVVHSATRFIGRHGTFLGGVIVDSGKFDWVASGKFPQLTESNPSYHGVRFVDTAGTAVYAVRICAVLLCDTGTAISPFNTLILLQGLKTLSLHTERHVENILKVVDFLEGYPKVIAMGHPSLLNYPDHTLHRKYFPKSVGSTFIFEVKDGVKEVQAFIDNLQIFSLLANVADVKSLVIHPAATTHSQLNEQELAKQGIKPGTTRLSIGMEHIGDLSDNVSQVLEKI